jgi:hypothetical protein
MPGLDVTRQINRLCDDKHKHDGGGAKGFKVDPRIGIAFEKHKCQIPVQRAHERKETIQARFRRVQINSGNSMISSIDWRIRFFLNSQVADQQHGRQQPIHDAEFPFDEVFVVQVNGQAAEHDEHAQRDPQHPSTLRPRSLIQPICAMVARMPTRVAITIGDCSA